jgi:hypothetical protein
MPVKSKPLMVAALATIFASSISAEVRKQQDQAQEAMTSALTRYGVCETPGVKADDNLPPGTANSLAALPAAAAAATKDRILSSLKLACEQSMNGFENAYQLTFYASIGALLLGLFLPGWPAKWGGRGSTQTPMPATD